jgi:hypothetical protein
MAKAPPTAEGRQPNFCVTHFSKSLIDGFWREHESNWRLRNGKSAIENLKSRIGPIISYTLDENDFFRESLETKQRRDKNLR